MGYVTLQEGKGNMFNKLFPNHRIGKILRFFPGFPVGFLGLSTLALSAFDDLFGEA